MVITHSLLRSSREMTAMSVGRFFEIGKFRWMIYDGLMFLTLRARSFSRVHYHNRYITINFASIFLSSEENAKTPLKLTYTAMHGVGYEFAVKSLETFNFKPPIPVKEQIIPDPEFPTVKYPNPEEGKSALVRTGEVYCGKNYV